MGSNVVETVQNQILEQALKDFPLMNNSELAAYVKSEFVELAHLSTNAIRCRIARIKDVGANVRIITVKLPTGDIQAKLIGPYAIPL